MNSIYLAAITTTADYMARWNVYPSDDADMWITQALKTVGYYTRVMYGLIMDLYNNAIPIAEFESAMLMLISNQYRRAWNEGMRMVGLSVMDITVGMENELQTAIANELNYLRGLIDDITTAQQNAGGYMQFRSRVEMWANRYTDIRNRALIAGGMVVNARFEWVLGATEKHCSDCLGYSGKKKTAREWDRIFRTTGHRPQSSLLACRGYNCDCELKRVDV